MNVIMGLGKPRKPYPAGDDPAALGRAMSLPAYLESARRIVGRIAPEEYRADLLADEDAISFVAENLMRGDRRYEESRGVKLSTWRICCGRKAIRKYLARSARARGSAAGPIPDDAADPRSPEPWRVMARNEDAEEASRYVRVLLSSIPPGQRRFVALRYLRGLGTVEIADRTGVRRQNVSQQIDRGLAHLRHAAGVC